MKPQWYASPIDLPEGRSGRIVLSHHVHNAGERLPIVGIRQAILRGVSPINVYLHEPLRVHELREQGVGVWMTDLPEELQQVADALNKFRPRGRVLVGGLGLGILARTLETHPLVESVRVVEINPDVINLTGEGIDVVQGDLREYLQTCEEFDCFMLDTWQNTNEGAWWEDVMPLKRIIRRRFARRPRVWCWAEDMMAAQVVNALQLGAHHWYYTHVPKLTETQARAFVRNVGLPTWERKYGRLVDRGHE